MIAGFFFADVLNGFDENLKKCILLLYRMSGSLYIVP